MVSIRKRSGKDNTMHRGRILIIGALGIMLVLSTLPPSTGGAEPEQQAANTFMSTTYQINPAHTGNLKDPSIRPPLQQLWAVDLGGIVSYPVVVGDKLFVTAAHVPTMPYGSTLYALDARTGANAWGPVELGGTYWWSAIAYDRGKIFVLNGDGLMRAYDAQSG